MIIARASNNAVPHYNLVPLIVWSLILQDEVEEELLGIPVEQATEVSVQTEIELDQVGQTIHERILNSLSSIQQKILD